MCVMPHIKAVITERNKAKLSFDNIENVPLQAKHAKIGESWGRSVPTDSLAPVLKRKFCFPTYTNEVVLRGWSC
eukprot:596272-Rhodomonas_salina.2